MMGKVKEMPYSDKYTKMVDNMKFDQAFILPFVREQLGSRAVAVLKETWQKGFQPISVGASFKEKYEVAYSDWICLMKSVYNFIRKQMNEDGIKKFERAEVEALKKKNAGPTLVLLKLIGLFSPGRAFAMTAKQIAYQLQWLTPYSVPELTRNKAVLDIPHCKILDFHDTDAICLVGCQSTYPMWVAEQFKVKMKFNRLGNSCTWTLTPLKIDA